MGNKLSSVLLTGASFIFIYAFLIFKIIIPFLKFNNLLTWDSAGLYFSTWYTQTHLFPRIIGWNPYFFLGYPQHQFYSPAYSYITSVLAQFFELELAFKLVLIIILILTPLSFYYFARSYSLSKKKASICMLVMFAVLFLFPMGHFGGDLYSTFKIGLLGHSLGFMLFFFYFGKLKRDFEENKFVISSILFALIILSHIISAVVAGFALMAFIFVRARKKEHFSTIGKHILLTFLLSAFWIVPFLAKFSYSNSSSIGTIKYLFLLFILLAGYFVYANKIKEKRFLSISVFLILILSASTIQMIIKVIPFHFYRVTLFVILMFPILGLSLIKKDNLWFYSLIIGSCIIFVLMSPSTVPEGTSDMYKLKSITENITGRVFIVAPAAKETSPHLLQQVIPMKDNLISLKGLYVESSKNSPYILTLEREMDKSALSWGFYIDNSLIDNKEKIEELMPYQFDLFNINYVIHLTNISSKWEKVQKISSFYTFDSNKYKLEKHSYNLYRVGNSSLIEVLNYKPQIINEENWDKESLNWFFSDDVKKGILVNEEVPNVTGTGQEIVKITNISPTQEYVKFSVESNKDVPILIKISEFPNWKAYGNGKKIKIYKASPNLMLIYGSGEIELKYERTWSDNLGYVLTTFGLIGLIYYLRKEQFLGRSNIIREKEVEIF